MAQTGASAAKVMRRKLLDTGTRRSRSNDLPITFGVIPSPQTRPALFIYRAKKYSLFDAARLLPVIDGYLHPARNRDGADVASLPYQIGDHPVFLSQLNGVDAQGPQLASTQPTPDQHGKHGVVLLPGRDSRLTPASNRLPCSTHWCRIRKSHGASIGASTVSWRSTFVIVGGEIAVGDEVQLVRSVLVQNPRRSSSRPLKATGTFWQINAASSPSVCLTKST
jgi:hypothetical protein